LERLQIIQWKFESEQLDVLAGDQVWVDGNAKLYRNLKNYIKLFNKNNNKVQIKDVFFFNETLKDVEMGESLLLLFEKEYFYLKRRLMLKV